MAELVREDILTNKNRDAYVVRVYGEERSDGAWEGWLEFHSTDQGKPILPTSAETSRPSRVTIEYCAYGFRAGLS